jgi:hypothetical protein
MTDQKNEPDLLDQQPQMDVNHVPPLAEREPRALVPFVAGGALHALVPQTPEEYGRLANLLIDAGCVPASYSKQGDPVHVIRAKLIIGLMKSVEIGVPPITGINGIMIVNNRPSVWGDLGVALIQRGGQLEKMEVREIGERPQPGLDLTKWDDNYGYRVLMWRRGQELPYVGEFTVDDAKRAKLWMNARKEPWINYTRDMLFNRARAKPMRSGFADYLHGMGIIEEERDVAPEEDARTVNTAALFSDEAEIEDAVIEEEDND